MTHRKVASGLFAITVATCSVAHAQATRSWVSGVGDDANPCSRTAPCKTFASAITKTSAGGEIDAIDAADYGPLAITKAITINGGGGQVVAAQGTGTTAISIQAASTDTVTIRNLDVIGAGQAGSGIVISGAGSVHLSKTLISGFQGNGISIPASSAMHVYIDDSTVANNGISGLTARNVGGAPIVSITGSHFEANAVAGITAAVGSKITAVDTTATGNASGFLADGSGSSASLTIIRCDAASNSGAGFTAINGGALRASYSSAEQNGAAVSTSNGGVTVSFGNNAINGAGVFSNTVSLH